MRATLAALGYLHSSAAREIWHGEIARSFQYTHRALDADSPEISAMSKFETTPANCSECCRA